MKAIWFFLYFILCVVAGIWAVEKIAPIIMPIDEDHAAYERGFSDGRAASIAWFEHRDQTLLAAGLGNYARLGGFCNQPVTRVSSGKN